MNTKLQLIELFILAAIQYDIYQKDKVYIGWLVANLMLGVLWQIVVQYEHRPLMKQTFMESDTYRKFIGDKAIVQKQSDKHEQINILFWNGNFIGGRSKQSQFLRNLAFKGCAVTDCVLLDDRTAVGINKAHVIIFNIWDRLFNFQNLPKFRPHGQKWMFLTVEAPGRGYWQKLNLTRLDDMFNLTATYRHDSDWPTPYGSYTEREHIDKTKTNFAHNKTKLIAWVASHCETESARENIVNMIQNHTRVDVYGQCGEHCPYNCLEYVGRTYYFYLALENNECEEYTTEKVWYNAFANNIVPVVKGKITGYKNILPPKSYILIDDFENYEELVAHLKKVASDPLLYSKYFEWKSKYKITYSKMGIYTFEALCRLCKAVHDTRTEHKTYKISKFWNASNQCAQGKTIGSKNL